jgi:uncharacterized membrane protein YcaP (DUF421 family)
METVLRVVIIYLFLMISLRILGKREFGQLSPLELVSLLLVPELVSSALQGDDYSLVDAIVGVSTLFALTLLTSMFMHISKTAEKVISGEPSVLVQHGQLLDKNMNRERITPDEIFSEIHKSGLERLEQVAWAILEGDGKIAIVPETQLDKPKPPQGSENRARDS